MIVPLIVSVVIAVAAVVWALTRAQAASAANERAEGLDSRVKSLEADLAGAAHKASFAEESARESEHRAIEQARRAEAAEREVRRSDEMAEEAVKRAIAAEHSATESRARAERAEVGRVEAERDLAATIAGAAPFQPAALWQLELQRIERLWRDRLCLQPGEPSPLVESKDVLGDALRILAETSREESGVVVDLMWHVDFECPPERCVQLIRLGEELIAAMRESEGGELEVIGEEDRTVFFLVRTLPPIELPRPLTDVLDGFGAMREVADTTVVVRVPVRDDAKVAEARVAGDEAPGGPDIDLTAEDEPVGEGSAS